MPAHQRFNWKNRPSASWASQPLNFQVRTDNASGLENSGTTRKLKKIAAPSHTAAFNAPTIRRKPITWRNLATTRGRCQPVIETPQRPRRKLHRNLVRATVFATVAAMADANDPDAVLMLRAKQGDHAAFEELVVRHQQGVINFIFRSVPDPAEAEDLAQNTFVQAWKARQRYQVSAKFTTWLFTIARNLTLNELRRRSRHEHESIDSPAGGGEMAAARQFEDRESKSAPEHLLRREIEHRVAEAVADLPEAQRTAILLCQDEDVSYEEIAKVLGASLSATKSAIFRARETLKQRLKPYLQSGAWAKSSPATFPKPR